MAFDANCKLMNSSAATDTVTGSWFNLHTRTPYQGIPLEILLSGGVATSTAKTVTIAIQGSTDGSTAAATVFSKAYTISTTANSSNFDEVVANLVVGYQYVRAVATFSAAISTGTDIVVAFVTGSNI